MNPEFDLIQQTFLAASAIAEPAARQAYLDNACKGDPELRRQVEALLFSHENAGEFLKRSVVPCPAESLTEAPGTTIGKYKLLQEIGEGGFGVVFMAEQLEPVQRKVALKVIKPGMDTREVIARFEAERQALALMDHPNVARVLDGGTTASGRPYFVMDLVKGTPITDFCDQNKLSPKDRLNLFLQVCAGVQHAHQKGVIHRDLKPTNVLVTVQDGLPLVKVIDFGIAKAIGQKLTEKTLFTRFEQLLGTPAYMSPEQAQWSGVDVDTRSDIYSLGVLLYELLTGTTPVEKETLVRVALDEVRRTIRELEPPAPSTRLRGLGQRLDQIAQHRRIESSQLARLVRGELDWIVMRALEKDRARRYETVNGLTRDVQRYLNNEPVSASPPSKAYLAGKFIRRHRLIVGSAGVVTTALVLGLGVALLGFSKARQESRRAKAAAESAEALTTFMREEILWQARPYFNPTNRNITLREVLDLASPKIDERFSRQPLVAATLHHSVGNTYLQLAEYDKSEKHLRKAVELRLALRQREPSYDLLDAQNDLGQLLKVKGKTEEAERILAQVSREGALALGTNHWLTLKAERELADIYKNTGRGYLAGKMYLSVLERQKQSVGAESDDALATANSLALLYFYQARFFEAADMYEAILVAFRKKDPDLRRADAVTVLLNLADVYFLLGEYSKAAEANRIGLENRAQALGPNDPGTVDCKIGLMKAEGCLGNWPNCVRLGEQIMQAGVEGHDNELYNAALCSLLTGNTNSFQTLTSRYRELSVASTNNAQEVAFLLTAAGPAICDAADATRAAERALANRTNSDSRITMGIAEYRRGNFPEALKWLEQPARGHDLTAALACFFVAAANKKLGNSLTCDEALKAAHDKLAPAVRNGFLWEHWPEYVRAVLAQREVEDLILGTSRERPPESAILARARDQWRGVKRHIDKGTELGGQSRWTEAAEELMAAVRSPQFDLNAVLGVEYDIPQRIVAALLAAKDQVSYQALRQQWIAWCRNCTEIPPDLVWACFLPAPSGDVGQGEEFLRRVTYDPSELSSYLSSLLLAFRAGDFERVLELRAPNPSEEPSIEQLRVKMATTKVFRAMALAKTGHLSEGSELLHQLEKTLAPYLEHYEGDLWWDIVFCKIALDEAHSMFREMASAK